MRSYFFLCSLLFALAPGLTNGQDFIVRGKVTSADDDKPLAGVNIIVKGTTDGAVTDGSGNFQLRVPFSSAVFFRDEPPPVLVFSHTGFRTFEIPFEGQDRVDVALRTDVAHLEEVVVTGTASGLPRNALSFAVGRISGTPLVTVPAPNVGSGLQGKVPGLRVNQVGGQPGQAAFFQIRSANAIANGQQPLIIVDGVFLGSNNLADINAEDIEKIEVLKGPAGASIYGSQAANGVIQIFTRRGQHLAAGETRVIYRGETGFSELNRRYDINNFTNREVLNPNGPQPILGNPSAENRHTIPLPNLQYYQEDFLFQRGLFQSHSLAVQGKSSATTFAASAQRLHDQGILRDFGGFTRHALRLNADHQASNKLQILASAAFSHSLQDLIPPSANGTGSFLANGLFMTPMFDLEATNEEDGTPYDWDIDNTGALITNPLYDRANTDQTVRRGRLMGSLGANFFANDWLSFNYAVTLDRAERAFEHFIEKGYLSTNIPGNFGPMASASTINSSGGAIFRSNGVSSYLTSRFNAVAERKFSGFHAILRGSFLYEDFSQRLDAASGENLRVGKVRSLDNAQSNIAISSESQDMVAYSGFLVADVDYKDKYFFSGLLRREGSSLFGLEEQWSNYYRLSGAYRLTQDVKIKGFREIKLRASVGTAGLRPGFGQRFETFDLSNGNIVKNTLGNPFLRPAFSMERELGIVASFWRAFDLEFNYATIETRDQILLTPLTAAAGFTGQWRNAGTVEGQVFEVDLNVDLARLFRIRSQGLHWSARGVFDHIRQKISALNVPSYFTGPGLQQSSLFLIEEGRPLGVMVGEVFATSLDQLQGQEGINPGDFTVNALGYVVRRDLLGTPNEAPYKLVDANGNPLLQVIGDINPDFRMGIAHTFGYRGLQLYTLFDWRKGGDVYNLTKQWLYRDQRHGDVSRNPEIAAEFFGPNGLYNLLVPNNHFVEDGSFFMLREVSLSYTFDHSALRSFLGGALHGIRLELIGRNLFTQTRYSGFHPDLSSAPRDELTFSNRIPDGRGSDNRTPNGDPSLFLVDAFNYPLPRTVTFSMQVIF